VAECVNSNNGWLASVAGCLDPVVLAGTANALGGWIRELLRAIDPSVVAGAFDEFASLVERVIDSLDPEALIALLNRLSRNRVLQQVAIEMAYEVPMRKQFMQGGVQLMGARRMDQVRRPKAAAARILPPGA